MNISGKQKIDGTEQKRQEDSELLKECYQGEIWAFADDTIEDFQKLRGRYEELQNSMNSLRSDSKQKTLNRDVNSLCSLSPCESELVEETESDLLCFDDDSAQKKGEDSPNCGSGRYQRGQQNDVRR